ncbi:DUF5590 domain-containing protein [Aneurinibacillus sp. BA2021]|nr:DUF5590 domain-containing protein [Aneurinibacillus sp. BA2021]
MKKMWVYGGIALVVLALCMALALYLHLIGQQRAIETRGKELALTRTQISEVLAVNAYYGTKDYLVIEGKTDSGEELVAWFHGEQGEVEKMSRLVSRQTVLNTLKKNHPAMEVLHIIPAKQENNKAWEVLFAEGRYLHYYYMDMYSGKFLKSYQLLKADT